MLAPSYAGPLSMWVQADGGRHVVYLDGELDVASRGLVLLTCAAVEHRVVTVDLTHLAFMDCAGYSGLVAARLVLEARGGSLTLDHVTGQPRRLLTLLDGLIGCRDAADPTPVDRRAQWVR
jgi:anti-anti-sigma factor